MQLDGGLDQFGAAFARAQSKFKHPKRDKSATVRHKTGGSHSYTYADLSATVDAVRPALNAEKISILQAPALDADGFHLLTVLLHESGQGIGSKIPLPAGVLPQELGSYITYYRRYALAAMCGIASEDDDDGASAQESGTPADPPPRRDSTATEPTNQARFETAVGDLVDRGASAISTLGGFEDPFAEMVKRAQNVLGAHGVKVLSEVTERTTQLSVYRDLEATVMSLEEGARAAHEAGL